MRSRTEQELTDGLVFFVAAAVVLPLLPNKAVDPFGLINPFSLWRLTVVLMGLSAAAYIAIRLLGPRYGLVLAGFASGFVSSTAAIAAMGGRARNDVRFESPGAAGAVASVIGSLLYLISLVATADLDVLARLARPFAVAIAATLSYALSLAIRSPSEISLPKESRRAFDLKTIALFVGLVGLFSLLSEGLLAWLGAAGVFGGAAATGLIDVHAAAVSIATMMASGKIGADVAAPAILIALSANMASKIPAAFALGPRPFAVRVALGLAALLLGLWSGYAWQVLSA